MRQNQFNVKKRRSTQEETDSRQRKKNLFPGFHESRQEITRYKVTPFTPDVLEDNRGKSHKV